MASAERTELHISVTGQSFSLREQGAPLDHRLASFQGFRYGDGPGAVLIVHGIQGAGYFRAIRDHFAEITTGVHRTMGFVFERHARIYQRMLRGKADVDVLFRDHPYGRDGPLMPWIVVTRKDDEDG